MGVVVKGLIDSLIIGIVVFLGASWAPCDGGGGEGPCAVILHPEAGLLSLLFLLEERGALFAQRILSTRPP